MLWRPDGDRVDVPKRPDGDRVDDDEDDEREGEWSGELDSLREMIFSGFISANVISADISVCW